MQEITERLFAQRIADLEATMVSQQAMIVALVYEIGKGERVTISKRRQRAADREIGELDIRRMANGELRFTTTAPEEAMADG